MEFHKVVEGIDQRLTFNQHCAEDIDRKLTSTDNYIEKYLPIKIHKFVISSLRNVFENKRELKKLRDYESKRDWLLNEVVRNDTGIPGDFKKSVPEEINNKLDKVRVSRKSKKVKEPQNVKKDSRIDESTSSLGTTSFIKSSAKKSPKKSTKKTLKKNTSKSNFSHKSSFISVAKADDLPDVEIRKRQDSSISYQNSAQEEERVNKILEGTAYVPQVIHHSAMLINNFMCLLLSHNVWVTTVISVAQLTSHIANLD